MSSFPLAEGANSYNARGSTRFSGGMSSFPAVRGKDLIQALVRAGFSEIRTKAVTISCAMQMAEQL